MSEDAERRIKVHRRVHFSAILPPSLICAGVIVFGIFLQAVWPLYLFPKLVYVRLGLGISLYIVGALLLVASIAAFRLAGERVSQKHSTKTIATEGPYKFSRNPMYLAYMMLTLGVALIFGNGWIITLLVPAAALIHWGVVRREEHYLRAKFEDEFRFYKLEVNRWF